MKIHRAHLKDAAYLALESLEEYERKELRYTRDSARLANIRALVKAVESGERIEIVDK
jgi:hypothetical protein